MSEPRRLELGQLDELSRWWRSQRVLDSEPSPLRVLSRVLEMAELTPAWVEPYQQVVDRMLAVHPTEPAVIAAREQLEVAAAACPQIVGLDLDLLALRRAEWIDGNLCLELEPGPAAPGVEEREQAGAPRRSAMFRVVGAEPRMWEVHGLPDLRIEQTMQALLVRTPMVRGEGQLIRSSY